jgi:hypothetical protein
MSLSSPRDPEETTASLDANVEETNKVETKDDETTKQAATTMGDEPVPSELVPIPPADAKRSAPTEPILTKPLKKGRTAYFIFADVKRAEVQAAVRSCRWPLKHEGCYLLCYLLGIPCDETNAWSGYSDFQYLLTD